MGWVCGGSGLVAAGVVLLPCDGKPDSVVKAAIWVSGKASFWVYNG